MKRTVLLLIAAAFLLCSCQPAENLPESSSSEIVSSETSSEMLSEEAASIKEAYPIAYDMLERWMKGSGEKVTFTDTDEIFKAITSSKKIEELAERSLLSYKNGRPYKNTWVEFTSDEPDLWLSVRKAFVDITVTEQEGAYTINMYLYDTYNFEHIESDDGIGSTLNNLGYMAEKMGVGKPYEWDMEFAFIMHNAECIMQN